MSSDERFKIAIIKLSALGDIIHTLPALAFLRERFPEAHISWIAGNSGATLLENFSGIDWVIPFNLKQKGIFNKLTEIRNLLRKHRGTFDLILDFQGLLKSSILTGLLKGKHTIGFNRENLKEGHSRFFYKQTAPYFDENRHVGYKNLHLAAVAAGKPESAISDTRILDRIQMKPERRNEWEGSVREFLTRHGLREKEFIIVNIGGGWETKLLPVQQYIDIIKGVLSRYRVVVLWGNSSEREVAERVGIATGAIVADYFNFSQLILVIEFSRLTVTGDTLALHLADLVKTPTVGIFGPTSPFRNGSLLPASQALFKKVPCGFCYKKKCGIMDCMKTISTEAIINSIEKIYENN